MKNIALIFTIAFLALLVIVGCKKSPLTYTSKIGGIRIWHGTANYTNPSIPSQDTTYNFIDTFPIIVVNNTTIVRGSGTLYMSGDTLYNKSSNNSDVISFVKYYIISVGCCMHYDSISYNYINNSIYYYASTGDHGGGTYTVIETTP